jgi:hypothetical protein
MVVESGKHHQGRRRRKKAEHHRRHFLSARARGGTRVRRGKNAASIFKSSREPRHLVDWWDHSPQQ